MLNTGIWSKKMENKPKSFLVINPFGIGDVLFSTPLIKSLKENFPSCEVFYLCNRRTQPVLKDNPLISKTFVYERDEFEAVKKVSKLSWIKKIMSFVSEIRKENIDIAVDLSLNSQFGFFAWFAGIKRRIGFDYKKRGRFLTEKIKMNGFEGKHVIEYYLDLLQFLKVKPVSLQMELFIDQKDRIWCKDFLESRNIDKSDLFICIAPGGGESFGKDAYRKNWALDNFVKLSERLQKDLKVKVCILLGPKEKDIGKAFSESSNLVVFSPSTIMQASAIIDRCNLFIANDSGLLRVADALDRKIVTIFGPVDERTYSPYPFDPKKHILIKKDLFCRPCYKKFRLPECLYDQRCLKNISVDEVFNAVRSLLNSDENKK